MKKLFLYLLLGFASISSIVIMFKQIQARRAVYYDAVINELKSNKNLEKQIGRYINHGIYINYLVYDSSATYFLKANGVSGSAQVSISLHRSQDEVKIKSFFIFETN